MTSSTTRAPTFGLRDAVLLEPRPVQQPVPLLIGGNGPGVLRLAGRRADIVGLTGLGRTLADGHHHQAVWAPEQIDATVELVTTAATDAGRTDPPVLEALVQHVELTDDRGAQRGRRSQHGSMGSVSDDVLHAPLRAGRDGDRDRRPRRRRQAALGHHTRFAVRPPALDAVEAVLAELARR